MLRIFHQYRPRQVARYVKGFFRGRIYIDASVHLNLMAEGCCPPEAGTGAHSP